MFLISGYQKNFKLISSPFVYLEIHVCLIVAMKSRKEVTWTTSGPEHLTASEDLQDLSFLLPGFLVAF